MIKKHDKTTVIRVDNSFAKIIREEALKRDRSVSFVTKEMAKAKKGVGLI